MLYYRARIEIDNATITEQSLFGKRRQILWADVHSFQKRDVGYCVQGSKQQIKFFGEIAGLPELKAEIARRAVNSRNRTWDEAETAGEPNVAKEQ